MEKSTNAYVQLSHLTLEADQRQQGLEPDRQDIQKQQVPD